MEEINGQVHQPVLLQCWQRAAIRYGHSPSNFKSLKILTAALTSCVAY
jgi:hypothetical protein